MLSISTTLLKKLAFKVPTSKLKKKPKILPLKKGNAPHMTPRNFKKDVGELPEESAKKFKEKVLEVLLTKYSVEEATNLHSALTYEKGKLIIPKKYVVNGKDYGQMWHVIEFGMKDKGVMPTPILKKVYDDFASTHKRKIEKLLPKSKNS